MGYERPNADPVSCSWNCHNDRTPPSSEPGTDYACARNTPVLCADPGRVIDVKASNSGAMGRYVAVALDDGRTVRYLHMQRCDVAEGARVARGQSLGISGASGYGSDTYYGPHTHATAWPGAYWAAPTIDFDALVGGDPAPLPPTYKTGTGDMETVVSAPNGIVVHLATGAKHNFSGPDEYNLIRDTLTFLQKRKQADVMLLPDLKDVARVDWDTFNALCTYFGVPAS